MGEFLASVAHAVVLAFMLGVTLDVFAATEREIGECEKLTRQARNRQRSRDSGRGAE